MTDSRTQNIRAISEQAAEWYLCFETENEASLADRKEFVQWLKASPEHIAEFMRVSAAHSQLANLDDREFPDLEALLSSARSNVVALPDQKSVESRREVDSRRSRVLMATAASFLVAAVLSVLWFAARWPAETTAVAGATYETIVGEQRSVLLSDGSVVELNTRSKLRVLFSDDARLVELAAGEAVFDVARSQERPFRVDAGSAIVEAVGTRFNVYRQESQTLVTVLEGRVAVTPPDSALVPATTARRDASPDSAPVQLAPGDQVAVTSLGAISTPVVVDTNKATAWTDRRLVFDGSSLATVAQELNRYNREQLRIADAALSQRTISGVFNANDPATLLVFLESIGGMRVEADSTGDGWILHTADTAPSLD